MPLLSSACEGGAGRPGSGWFAWAQLAAWLTLIVAAVALATVSLPLGLVPLLCAQLLPRSARASTGNVSAAKMDMETRSHTLPTES